MKRTVNTIIYALLLIMTILIFFVFQSFFIMYILIFLIIVPVVSTVSMKYVSKKLQLSVKCIKEAIDVEQQFYIILEVENPTFIPVVDANVKCSYLNAFYNYKENITLSVPLYAKGKQEIKLPVKSKYCGIVEVNVEDVIIWDMLHILNAKCEVEVQNNIVLYPTVNEYIQLDVNVYVPGNDDSEESNRKGSDFAEVSDIREYIPGDSLKDIHWKLSSKQDKLMVKEHVTMSSKQIAVLVELFNDDNYVLDDIIKTVYSACVNLAKENFTFTLYWWSQKVGEMKSKVIVNMYDVEETFKEIFFEQPYNQLDRALSEFGYLEEHIEKIIYVSKVSENENVIYGIGQAVLSYREVE